MPTYLHECQNKECNHEWEDFYSITATPPTTCPKCQQETARRVINSMTKGVVELSGNEIIEKHKTDVSQLKKELASSEKAYANVLGEDRYHKLQTQMDRRGK